MEHVRYLPIGDTGLFVEFENKISQEVNEKVRNLWLALEFGDLKGINEIIPTYRSLFIIYNPGVLALEKLISKIQDAIEIMVKKNFPKPVITEIPVLYGGEYGPDLEFIAEYHGLMAKDVIEIHSSRSYLIHMLGFAPGFPYLGGMSKKIATPRLKKPRVSIPAGSVGIADQQTGVYPLEGPAGWRLVGRTPLRLFDPHREPPILLKAGNYILFRPIDLKEYGDIEKEVMSGCYNVKRWEF
ncbi:MAG: allophanate hydrolase [Desulfotomaculum sp. BICA1-6]|nr:MAG: allophanate hydrolase [Peptococcaceae bacterium BRH_c8a]KJS73648.1 MAG: allophanate hydrolase [Desulfotomaculum sp. BICA1-6]